MLKFQPGLGFSISKLVHRILLRMSSMVLAAAAAAGAANSLQLCPTLCDPKDGSPPAPPSLGFSRQNAGVGGRFLLHDGP